MKRLFKRLQDLAAARPHARRPFAGHLSARLFLCLFLLLCCAGGLRGQEYLHRLETAIDMGTYDGSFTYRDSVDTSDYTDDFSLPEENWFTANDVFYRLAMSRSADLDLWYGPGRQTLTCGTGGSRTALPTYLPTCWTTQDGCSSRTGSTAPPAA